MGSHGGQNRVLRKRWVMSLNRQITNCDSTATGTAQSDEIVNDLWGRPPQKRRPVSPGHGKRAASDAGQRSLREEQGCKDGRSVPKC